MHPLVWLSIDAHGGIDRWRRIRQISASFIPSGTLVQHGLAPLAQTVTRISVDTREQMAVLEPFLARGQSACFQPYITSVDSCDGRVLESLISPRSSFAGMAPGTPWSATQLAYVVGYAAWMYLTVPFSLMRAGVRCVETDPWEENGELWRAIKVHFPHTYVMHSREQVIYLDHDGLIRRHDCTVDIAGGARTAHYAFDHRDVDGIVFPTRRCIYMRDAFNVPQKDSAVVVANLSDFEISRFS